MNRFENFLKARKPGTEWVPLTQDELNAAALRVPVAESHSFAETEGLKPGFTRYCFRTNDPDLYYCEERRDSDDWKAKQYFCFSR